MIGLVLHALWVAALLGGAALAAEAAARTLRLPTRGIWMAALVASVALVAWGLANPGGTGPTPPVSAAGGSSVVEHAAGFEGDEAPGWMRERAQGHGGAWASGVAGAPALAAAWVDRRVLHSLPARGHGGAHLFLAGWALGSLALLLLLLGGAWRHRHLRRRWPRVEVQGHPVRIAPRGGPAVAGFRTPEILLPGWALALPAPDLALLLRHEEEHRRARDPLLAGLAFVLVALLPWNPFLWWQLHRLRDAVEVDCDARVLGRPHREGLSSSPRSYAELLLSVGSRLAGERRSRLSAPSLTPMGGGRSQLERRLLAMRTERPRPFVAGPAAAAALFLVTAACLADQPTPVAPAEGAAHAVSPEEATHAAPAAVDAPASVVVAPPAGAGSTAEDTPPAADGAPSDPVGPDAAGEAQDVGHPTPENAVPLLVARDGADGEGATLFRPGGPTSGEGAPLYVVDGVILAEDGLDRLELRAEDIVSVEVTRGASASRLYGTRAANGVVSILTRAGEAWREQNPPPSPDRIPLIRRN